MAGEAPTRFGSSATDPDCLPPSSRPSTTRQFTRPDSRPQSSSRHEAGRAPSTIGMEARPNDWTRASRGNWASSREHVTVEHATACRENHGRVAMGREKKDLGLEMESAGWEDRKGSGGLGGWRHGEQEPGHREAHHGWEDLGELRACRERERRAEGGEEKLGALHAAGGERRSGWARAMGAARRA
jgi:hypothetical protein